MGSIRGYFAALDGKYSNLLRSKSSISSISLRLGGQPCYNSLSEQLNTITLWP